MAYSPSDPNYYVTVSDPCGANAQHTGANQMSIPSLSMQQEKFRYMEATGSGLGGLSPYIGDSLPQPTTKSCPCCGYCPHCGRSNQMPTYYPAQPYTITCANDSP